LLVGVLGKVRQLEPVGARGPYSIYPLLVLMRRQGIGIIGVYSCDHAPRGEHGLGVGLGSDVEWSVRHRCLLNAHQLWLYV